ncbi:hypothetical protein SEA_YUNGMONEY_37 [Gordonia phage YungMoney]|nr:hypothetical protein SEA_YUNGMONEY_37 [Gordonia phage YungMoney]
MATITFTVDGPESRGGGLATFTPRVDMTVDGVLVTPGKSWRDVPYTFNVQAETDLPEGQWWIRGIDKHRYPIDVTGPADVKDLIVHGLPDNAPATTLSQAAAAWLEANVDTEVTGPLVEGILADPESAARGVLDGAYAPADVADEIAGFATVVDSKDDGMTVADFMNSWWCLPRFIHDPIRSRSVLGGITRGGDQRLGVYDLRKAGSRDVPLSVERFEPDDHNVPAFLVPDDRAPIVAYTYHDRTNKLHYRIGITPGDVDNLGPEQIIDLTSVISGITGTSYMQLLRKPGTATVAMMFRVSGGSNIGWWKVISTDWGATWGTPVKLHGKSYQTWKQVGDVIHVAVTDNPTSNVGIYQFKINLATGAITRPDGTAIDSDFWTTTTAITITSQALFLISSTLPESIRLLDVAPDGQSVLIATFNHNDLDSGVFKVVRRNSSNQLVTEVLGPTGRPFGYESSFYIGGGCFGRTSTEVFAAREQIGQWRMNRWGSSAGTWSIAETVYTAPWGAKLGRPQIPHEGEGSNLLAFGQYWRYLPAVYTDYYAEQKIMRLSALDTTPPSAPTGLTAATADGYLTLSWTGPSDAIAYRIRKNGSDYAVVSASPAKVNGANGTPITAQVIAIDAAGNESTAVSVTATPAAMTKVATSGGAIYLAPADSTTPWTGVPTHGATVPNLVGAQAQAMAGTGVASDFNLTVANTLTATDGAISRTGKGALYGLISQTTDVQNRAFELSGAALRAMFAARTSDIWFIAAWVRVMRQPLEAPPLYYGRFLGPSGTGTTDVMSVRPVTSNKLSIAPSTNRTNIVESATPAPLDTPLNIMARYSSLGAIHATEALMMRMGIANQAAQVHKAPSWMLYEYYVENLTVSGRAYSTVSQMWADDFTAAFGTSGKYAGDTYPAVSTLP